MAGTVIVGQGGPGDPRSLGVFTKKGTRISNEQRMEKNPAELRAAEATWAIHQPDAVLRRSSNTYDCMGLAFASRRTWIDIAELNLLIDGDELRYLEDHQQPMAGDLLLYARSGEPSHIGIVLDVERDVIAADWQIRVLSKWGSYGEYIHAPNDVPYLYGQPSAYLTDRR